MTETLRPRGLRVTQFSILAAIARMVEAPLKQLHSALGDVPPEEFEQLTLNRATAPTLSS